jgi:hypothetical protein
MGIRSYIRDRKQVKADRAESGSHQKLVSAFTPDPDRPKRAGAPTGPLPKPNREYGNPPSSTPASNNASSNGPVDRGNSPLADEPRTEAWGAKMAGIHNTSGFIGSDGKRH